MRNVERVAVLEPARAATTHGRTDAIALRVGALPNHAQDVVERPVPMPRLRVGGDVGANAIVGKPTSNSSPPAKSFVVGPRATMLVDEAYNELTSEARERVSARLREVGLEHLPSETN